VFDELLAIGAVTEHDEKNRDEWVAGDGPHVDGALAIEQVWSRLNQTS